MTGSETPESLDPTQGSAPTGDASPLPGPEAEEDLPKIEAREYPVKTVKMSGSMRVYLFDYGQGQEPRVGRILLLSKGVDPAMAFRVLKTYPDKKQFAGKRVKRYGPHQTLDLDASYDALEKLADITPPPPPTRQDLRDLNELEGLAPPPGSPLEGAPGSADIGSLDDLDEDIDLGLSLQEVHPLDWNHHAISLAYGYLRNQSSGDVGAYFQGAGLEYSLSFHRLLVRKVRVQDAFSLDLGAYVYKLIGYESINDAYSVLPTLGALRYGFQLGDSFHLSFYGGVLKNWVIGVSQGTEAGIVRLQSLYPAAGASLAYRFGPQWEIRFNLGFERFMAALSLRF